MTASISTGSPTALSTITMVTRPSDGIPAAPTAARVAVSPVTTTWPKFRDIPFTWAMKRQATWRRNFYINSNIYLRDSIKSVLSFWWIQFNHSKYKSSYYVKTIFCSGTKQVSYEDQCWILIKKAAELSRHPPLHRAQYHPCWWLLRLGWRTEKFYKKSHFSPPHTLE